jgi:hypothetical protein
MSAPGWADRLPLAARPIRANTSVAGIANHLHPNARITDKCAAIAAFGTPFLANHVRTQAALSARSRGPAVGSSIPGGIATNAPARRQVS